MLLTINRLLISIASGLLAMTISFVILRKIATLRGTKPRTSSPFPTKGLKRRFGLLMQSLLMSPPTKESRKAQYLFMIIIMAIMFIITRNIIFTIVFGIIGYAAVHWYRALKIEKQADRFNIQLIDGLGTVRSSVMAGQSLGQAIETVVNNSQPPLATEFSEVLRKTKLGIPLSTALEDMTKHINSTDLRIAVLSMNIAKESGGNMGEILMRLTDTMRERQKIKGRIKALTAQGKASGLLMSLVPFILLLVLYLMEPDIMGLLFTTLAGNIMLALVVIMIGTGTFFISRIVRIDI